MRTMQFCQNGKWYLHICILEWILRKLEWNYSRWEIFQLDFVLLNWSFHLDPTFRILCNFTRVCGGFFYNTLSNILFSFKKEEYKKQWNILEKVSWNIFVLQKFEIFHWITQNELNYQKWVVLPKMSGITLTSLQWNYNVTKSIINETLWEWWQISFKTFDFLQYCLHMYILCIEKTMTSRQENVISSTFTQLRSSKIVLLSF